MKKYISIILQSEEGFTLIEMMVVIIIIGMIAGLIGPKAMKQLGKAKVKTAAVQIERLGAALDTFKLDVGRYPSTAEGLEALVSAPGGGDNWDGPYLQKEKVPKDPWSHEYEYRCPGDHGEYDIVSLGADGQPGGGGKDADIGSWE